MKEKAKSIKEWIKGHKKTVLVIAAVLAVAAVFGVRKLVLAKSAGPAEAETETANIERMDLTQSLTLSGTVETGATYSVSSTVTDVEVVAVNVKEGDRVHAGDVIAVLDDSELSRGKKNAQKSLSNTKRRNSESISSAKRSLENAKEDKASTKAKGSLDVKAAEAQLTKANNEVNDLKSRIPAAEAVVPVKQAAADRAAADVAKEESAGGDLAVRLQALTSERKAADLKEARLKELIDKGAPAAEIAAARKAYEEEIVKLAAVQTEYDYLKDLIDAESEAADELSAAQASVTSLQAQLKTAQDNADSAKLDLAKAKSESSEANRNASRSVSEQKSALNTAKLSAEESLDAPKQELEKAEKELQGCIVRAETDGVVTSVSVKKGDTYKGDAIAVINDDSSYRVSATVDQYDINSLADGQYADITIKAADLVDAPGRLIHVARTPVVSTGSDGAAASSSGSAEYQVETLIEGPTDDLKIGMTAKVVVRVWQKKDVLAVPDSCVQTDENGEYYIEVETGKGKTKKIPVKYGMKTDYYSEISGKGVEEGMTVIVPPIVEDDLEGLGGEEF